jgi:hypothetical protein
MKHYLKNEGKYGTVSHAFYDFENKKSIVIDKWCIEIEDDMNDPEWDMGYALKNEYKFITREEFETAYKAMVTRLNNISKEI